MLAVRREDAISYQLVALTFLTLSHHASLVTVFRRALDPRCWTLDFGLSTHYRFTPACAGKAERSVPYLQLRTRYFFVRFEAAFTVLAMISVVVIGPTPPGTGVIKLAFFSTPA